MSIYRLMGVGLAALCALSSSASAEAPKFEYAKNEKTDAEGKLSATKTAPVWKASAQAGLLLTTGNASNTTVSSGFRASRKAGKNKLQLDLAGAFARSTIYLAVDENASGTIEENELNRITKTTSQSWLAKARYDRFLSVSNALYTSASLSADEPAGRILIGSGQVGYSRTLVDNKVHQIVLESGYDFSYEDRSGSDQSLSIHSWRIFAGYQGKLNKETSLEISTESLFNINTLETSAGPVAPFDDTRFNNQVSLTTNIYGDVNFRFSFQSRFDNNPAPRPNLELPYDAGFGPLADKLDTRTEAAILVNFL